MKAKPEDTRYYPMAANITGRQCAVIGGGQVALRKVAMLLEAGAEVTVISPDLCQGLADMTASGEIRVINRDYRRGDLGNAFVAIAATDNTEINARIVAEARERAVLLNVVDDAESSDFIVPSYIRRNGLTITVSTSGKSPALARKIRSILEMEFTDDYSTLVDIIGEVRAELKKQAIMASGDDWQDALDLGELLDLVRAGKGQEAKALLFSKLDKKQRRVGTK